MVYDWVSFIQFIYAPLWNRATIDLMFSLKQLIEKNWNSTNICLLIAFIDFESQKIWECLRRLELNSNLTERIKQVYKRTLSCVKTKGGRSECSKPKMEYDKVAYYQQSNILSEICLEIKKKHKYWYMHLM